MHLEICGLLGNYAASCGNYLPTFRDNISVPSSRVKIRSMSGVNFFGAFWNSLHSLVVN